MVTPPPNPSHQTSLLFVSTRVDHMLFKLVFVSNSNQKWKTQSKKEILVNSVVFWVFFWLKHKINVRSIVTWKLDFQVLGHLRKSELFYSESRKNLAYPKCHWISNADVFLWVQNTFSGVCRHWLTILMTTIEASILLFWFVSETSSTPTYVIPSSELCLLR